MASLVPECRIPPRIRLRRRSGTTQQSDSSADQELADSDVVVLEPAPRQPNETTQQERLVSDRESVDCDVVVLEPAPRQPNETTQQERLVSDQESVDCSVGSAGGGREAGRSGKRVVSRLGVGLPGRSRR
jgi:hypothetical protein